MVRLLKYGRKRLKYLLCNTKRMNWKEQMAAYILAFIIFGAVILGGYRADASIYAFRANNSTKSFEDALSSFGPDVNSERGVLYRGEPVDGCSNIKPPTDFNGNFSFFSFVLLERGKCDFALKVLNAQLAGYLAAIVYNVNSNDVIHMSSGLPEIVNKIYIPSVFVGQDTAKILNQSYLHHESGNPHLELVPSHFSIMDYLVPFVVVIAICFISLLCFLCVRCIRDYRRTKRGRLSLQRLKKLPVKKYAKEDEYDVCAICLEDYDEGDVLRILPCHHAYHCKCVDPWLTSSKRICPLCKRKVLSDDETTTSSGDIGGSSDDDDDDENTPLVPESEAASPNAPRYGTGYSLRNPFRSRLIGRRLMPSLFNGTSSGMSDLEANDDTPGTSAQSASRLSATSSPYQSQELSPPHPSDSEISQVMNSGQYNQTVGADKYLDSAEVMLTHQSRMSESSITVLSDEETEEVSPEPLLSCSSADYYTVDESIATARTPYNLEPQLEVTDNLNQEDIIVIATGSTTAVQGEEEV